MYLFIYYLFNNPGLIYKWKNKTRQKTNKFYLDEFIYLISINKLCYQPSTVIVSILDRNIKQYKTKQNPELRASKKEYKTAIIARMKEVYN